MDKLLHRIAFLTVPIQIEMDDLETTLYGRDTIHSPEADRPVFITALPRAGTTLLLELLAGLDEFATHTYKDMPFVMLPLMWNQLSTPFRQTGIPTERAHGDGMLIGADSPEAFEEMIWKAMWKEQYLTDRILPWTTDDHGEFLNYFYNHLKKIIKIQQKKVGTPVRYISKNNLNIARIEWLMKAFPQARVVVPFREPLQHAASLLKQHCNFLKIHAENSFAREYMEGIGHYDFGSNLKPINFNHWLDKAHSKDETSLSFWIEYWVETYSYLSTQLGNTVKLMSFESLCEDPISVLGQLADFLQIQNRESLITQRNRINIAKPHPIDICQVAPDLISKANVLYEEMQIASL